jgi:integrase
MGTIDRDMSGAWRARYRDPSGKQRSRNFPRRRDAEQFLTSVDHSKAINAYVDPALGRITLGSWVKDWRKGVVDLRPSTLARDDGYIDRYLLPTFERRRLADIDHADVRAWVAERSARGLAPATVVKAAQIMGKIMAVAVQDGRLAASPCTGLRLPHIERREMRFLTPGEVAALAEVIDPRYRALVYLGGYGGLRIGEIFGLRSTRVDLLRARVEVADTLVEVSGNLHFGPPKTRAGRRTVPLPRVAVTALDQHFREFGSPDGLVFTAPAGGPVRLASWRRRFWLPATKAAGVAPLRPHDLRHTAVALWIAAGATPKEIATRAGHSSVVTVLDRYGHLLPGSEERVNAALDALAEGIEPARAAEIRRLDGAGSS